MSQDARNVSDPVGKSGIIGPSIAWGTIFGAVIACGLFAYAVAASGARMANGDFGLLFGLGVVPVLFLGGTAGALLFGVVGVIVRLGPGWLAPSSLTYAALSTVVWGAGGSLLALKVPHGGPQGAAQGDHSLLFYSLLAVAVAGLLTGGAVRQGRHQPYRTSRPGAN